MTCVANRQLPPAVSQARCPHFFLQITFPAVPGWSCSLTALHCPLYHLLGNAVHTSFSRSLFQLFLGGPVPPQLCSVHCITCLAMLSTHLSPDHFSSSSWVVLFLHSFAVYTVSPAWQYCPHVFLQITFPAVPGWSCSCTALQFPLYHLLSNAVHTSFSRSLFQLFLGGLVHSQLCSVHCITCLAMLSTLLSPDHFSSCSWVVLFLHSLAVYTV